MFFFTKKNIHLTFFFVIYLQRKYTLKGVTEKLFLTTFERFVLRYRRLTFYYF